MGQQGHLFQCGTTTWCSTPKNELERACVVGTYCHPLKHNILLYCDLNNILPATQYYTKPKSFHQI